MREVIAPAYSQLEGDEEVAESPASVAESPASAAVAPEAPELPAWLPDGQVEVEAPKWFEHEWYARQAGWTADNAPISLVGD